MTYGQPCGEKSFLFEQLKIQVKKLCDSEGCKGSDLFIYP